MKKVMLYEDDRSIMGLLTTLLQIEGYQVTQFEGLPGENLTEQLSGEKADILLMDVLLRQANGIEILQKLREDENLRDLRIIMISGLSVKEECLKAGANAFVMKPFMPDELMDTIRKQVTV